MLLFFFVLQVHIGHTHRTFERNLKNERVRERQERVAKTKKKLLSLHFLKRRESRGGGGGWECGRGGFEGGGFGR